MPWNSALFELIYAIELKLPWNSALFELIYAIELIWCNCIQLQLTYRPEEGPSEDTKLSNDEPEPSALADDIAVSGVETVPVPPPPPQNNADGGDLLVMFHSGVHHLTLLLFIMYHTCFILLLIAFWWVQDLSYSAPDALAIEESNALALAIVPTEPGKILFLFFFSFPLSRWILVWSLVLQ